MYGKIRNRDTKIGKPLQSRDLSTGKLGHLDRESSARDSSESPDTDLTLSLHTRGRLEAFRYGDAFQQHLANTLWETDHASGSVARDPDLEIRVSSQTIAGISDTHYSASEDDTSFHTARDSDCEYIIPGSRDGSAFPLSHEFYSELPDDGDNASTIPDCPQDLEDIDEFDQQIDDTELMSALDSFNEDGHSLCTVSGGKPPSPTVPQNWDDNCMPPSTQPGEQCENGFSMNSSD
jgi:hypothetical protein